MKWLLWLVEVGKLLENIIMRLYYMKKRKRTRRISMLKNIHKTNTQLKASIDKLKVSETFFFFSSSFCIIILYCIFQLPTGVYDNIILLSTFRFYGFSLCSSLCKCALHKFVFFFVLFVRDRKNITNSFTFFD